MRSSKIFSRWRHILFSKSQFNNPNPKPNPDPKPTPKPNPKPNPGVFDCNANVTYFVHSPALKISAYQHIQCAFFIRKVAL